MRNPVTSCLLTVLVLVTTSPLGAQEPNFGRALAVSGGELFVGQPLNWYGPGVVYAFSADAGGRWREGARLMAPDSARMDGFGQAIAADGNTVAVGAPSKRDGAGVVYLFDRAEAGSAWRASATIEAPLGGEFGLALSLSGDDLLVGATC